MSNDKVAGTSYYLVTIEYLEESVKNNFVIELKMSVDNADEF